MAYKKNYKKRSNYKPRKKSTANRRSKPKRSKWQLRNFWAGFGAALANRESSGYGNKANERKECGHIDSFASFRSGYDYAKKIPNSKIDNILDP